MTLLDAIREIVRDPASNFTAVAIAIAIVVLFVVIIALGLIALALPASNKAPKPQPTPVLPGDVAKPAKKRRAAGCVWGVAILLGGLIGAAALWYDTTSNNTYCTRTCHAMAEPTRTWSRSPHANVTCVRCHEGVAWVSIVPGLVGRSRSLFYEVSGLPAKPTPVPAKRCLECHADVLGQFMRAPNNEPFLHKDLLAEGRTCESCHGPQGHVQARDREVEPDKDQ